MSDDKVVSLSSKSKKTGFSKIRNISFGRSRAYLFEYGLLLVLTIALINILAMMLQEVIGKQASFIQNSLYFIFPVGFTDITFELFAAFLVVFPAVIILIQRTAAAERLDSSIKNISWRKGLLSVFLGVSALWAIVGLISVIAGAVEYVSLMSLTDVTYDWREAVENIFKAVLLLLAVWAFSSDYRSVKGEKTPNVMHLYRYTVVGSGVVLFVVFAIFPLLDNRKEFVDNRISEDLYAIQGQVSNEYYMNYSLPESIDNLQLNESQKERVSEHNYKYEKVSETDYKICATFLAKSDGSSKFGGPEIAIYPPISGDFYSHEKGEKCFDLSVQDYGMFGMDKPITAEPTTTEVMTDEQSMVIDPSTIEPTTLEDTGSVEDPVVDSQEYQL